MYVDLCLFYCPKKNSLTHGLVLQREFFHSSKAFLQELKSFLKKPFSFLKTPLKKQADNCYGLNEKVYFCTRKTLKR